MCSLTLSVRALGPKMGLKWPYFAKMTPPKKMTHPLPPEKTHKHPKNKKIPSYSEKKPGQSYGRLFMKNTIE
jgi:hypothetical protein